MDLNVLATLTDFWLLHYVKDSKDRYEIPHKLPYSRESDQCSGNNIWCTVLELFKAVCVVALLPIWGPMW